MAQILDFAAVAATLGGNARKLANLSRLARVAGDPIAYELAARARALAPDDAEVVGLTAKTIAKVVQAWHFNIARDRARLDAYRTAIDRLVKPGDRVLDIGAGSGILSMLAVRAGAAHVFACEGNPPVADAAAAVIAANGMADRITLIPKLSTALDAEDDLGGRVDVIISEILSDDLVGELVLPYLKDAHDRLLKPGGKMMPATGQIVVAPAFWQRIEDERELAYAGFDLNAFHRIAPPSVSVIKGVGKEIALRGAAVDLFDFDFTLGDSQVGFRTSAPLSCADGTVNGVLLWMQFQFDSEQNFTSYADGKVESSWSPIFYPLAEARELDSGQTLSIHAIREPDRVCLWADPA